MISPESQYTKSRSSIIPKLAGKGQASLMKRPEINHIINFQFSAADLIKCLSEEGQFSHPVKLALEYRN
jgi:hypothetical protein